MNPTEISPSTARPGLFRRTLRRWSRPILALWLVGTVALLSWIFLVVPPLFRASAFLRVAPAAPNLYGVRTNGNQTGPFLQTQVQLITSSNVLTDAGTNPRVAALPRIRTAGDVVLELRKALTVGVVPETYLIEVAMTSPSADEAATIVNAVIDSFLASSHEWTDGMTRNQIKNLETYLAGLQDKDKILERRWKDLLARETDARVMLRNPPDPSAIGLTLEDYRRLRQVLFEKVVELAEAEATATALKAASMVEGKAPGSKADEEALVRLIERRFKTDPEAIELASRLIEARGKLEEVRRVTNSPDDPAVRSAIQRLEDLTARYSQLSDRKSRAYRDQILNEPEPLRELAEVEARVRALRSEQDALKALLGKLEVDRTEQANTTVEIELIREERQALRSMRDTVALRLEQLKFEAKGEARIRQVNKAIPPLKPIRDPRLMGLAVVPLAMAPIAFAFFAGVEWLVGSRPRTAKSEPESEV